MRIDRPCRRARIPERASRQEIGPEAGID